MNYINVSWYENSSLLSAASGVLVMIQLIDMSLVWGRENKFLGMVPKVLVNFQICLHHLWCQIHVHVWIPLWRCIETNLDPMINFLESIAFNVHLAYSNTFCHLNLNFDNHRALYLWFKNNNKQTKNAIKTLCPIQ